MVQAAQFKVGEEVPVYPRQATLVPPPGGYKWGSPHNDEYARTVLGLRGGLVPGVTLLAYATEFLVQLFGEDWFTSGAVESRFVGGGVIDKENTTIHGRVTGIEPENGRQRIKLDIWMEREDGQTGLVGAASCFA